MILFQTLMKDTRVTVDIVSSKQEILHNIQQYYNTQQQYNMILID